MKTLNNYILEKFKIGKDIKTVAPKYEKGDEFMYVFIENLEDEDSSEEIGYLRFIPSYFFEKIEKNTIYFSNSTQSNSVGFHIYEFNVFLNKNGYYEVEKNEPLYGQNGIFIPLNEGKELVEDLIKIHDLEKFINNKLPQYMENISKLDTITTTSLRLLKKMLKSIDNRIKDERIK